MSHQNSSIASHICGFAVSVDWRWPGAGGGIAPCELNPLFLGGGYELTPSTVERKTYVLRACQIFLTLAGS